MVELVDTGDLKSPDRKVVRVQVPFPVFFFFSIDNKQTTAPRYLQQHPY
jgi:hypothetical protein